MLYINTYYNMISIYNLHIYIYKIYKIKNIYIKNVIYIYTYYNIISIYNLHICILCIQIHIYIYVYMYYI